MPMHDYSKSIYICTINQNMPYCTYSNTKPKSPTENKNIV